jgi:hypothetical protein
MQCISILERIVLRGGMYDLIKQCWNNAIRVDEPGDLVIIFTI